MVSHGEKPLSKPAEGVVRYVVERYLASVVDIRYVKKTLSNPSGGIVQHVVGQKILASVFLHRLCQDTIVETT